MNSQKLHLIIIQLTFGIGLLSVYLSLDRVPAFSSGEELPFQTAQLPEQVSAPRPLQLPPALTDDRVTTANLAILKKYAEVYEPKGENGAFIPDPPHPPARVLQAIESLSSSDSKEREKYILLIFIRLYRFHLERCRQSYELGRDNRLTREFYKIAGRNDYQKSELLSSGLAEEYIRANPALMDYSPIEKEIQRLKKAGESP